MNEGNLISDEELAKKYEAAPTFSPLLGISRFVSIRGKKVW